jgi:hypothetical protein
LFKHRVSCHDRAPGSALLAGLGAGEAMSERPHDPLRREVLAAVEIVMSSAMTAFAELLAVLLESGSLDRAQLESAFKVAEDTLARDGLGKTPLGAAFIPTLRMQLDELVEEMQQRAL